MNALVFVFAAMLASDGPALDGSVLLDASPIVAPAEGGGTPGACCFPGACAFLSEEECDLEGGVFLGEGVPCNQSICSCGQPATNECYEADPKARGCNDPECCAMVCLADPFCCEVAWEELCADLANDICPFVCCVSKEECLEVGPYLCIDDFGGMPVTDDTCTPLTCTTGACCFPAPPGRDCIITTPRDCDVIGGIFLGLGTDCPGTQTILTPIHTATEWTHVIEQVSLCPDEFPESGPFCADGPYFIDPWGTPDLIGFNCEDFSVNCPIPNGFFGPGSDPFSDVVCFQGNPIGETLLPGFGQPLDFGAADTLVRRESDPFDRCELPSATPAEVPIVMEQLSLVSSSPIVVTFNGGQDPEQWNVQVVVDDSANQPGGSLIATKTHCNGGVFDSTIAVCPQFVFTRIGDGTQVTLDFCNTCDPAGIVMESNGVGWVHDVEPGLGVVNPVCTQFAAGIDQVIPKTDCDCNSNNVRDLCDVESLSSKDCNGDQIPDECQPGFCASDTNCDGIVNVTDLVDLILDWGCQNPPGPCTSDVNQDGIVNVGDLVQTILEWGPC